MDGPGTSLIIPFPNSIYSAENIKAGLIAHFLPALLDNRLKARVSVDGDEEEINQSTINNFVGELNKHLDNSSKKFQALKRNPDSFIDFLNEYTRVDPIYNEEDTYEHGYFFKLEKADYLHSKAIFLNEEKFKKDKDSLLESINSGELTTIKVEFPIIYKDGTEKLTFLTAGIKQTENMEDGIEISYRNGMAIYKIKEYLGQRYHACLFADDQHISDYLNACEGVAHQSWDRDTEVTDELKRQFNNRTIYGIYNLSKYFFSSINSWMNKRSEEVDLNLLLDDFSIPLEEGSGKSKNTTQPNSVGDEGEDTPPRNDLEDIESRKRPWNFGMAKNGGIKVFGVDTEDKDDFPLNVKITLAYSEGGSVKTNKWVSADFSLDDLYHENIGCEIISMERNEIIINSKNENFKFTISGFDENRALDAKVTEVQL